VPLLVLDEPTADLDPESEDVVGRALEQLRGARTVLLITHRLHLAEVADRVLLLAGGKCVEPTALVVA
jgi:ABC-type transport system involved in cytochrome bd biosynthesis fused ATPase/permease subunit